MDYRYPAVGTMSSEKKRRRSPDKFRGRSSWIDSGTYVKDGHDMILIFKGRQYTHCDVSKRAFTNLRTAKSRGKYYHKWMKGRYVCAGFD